MPASSPGHDSTTLLSCQGCGEIFIQWGASQASCRRCNGHALAPIRAYGDASAYSSDLPLRG